MTEVHINISAKQAALLAARLGGKVLLGVADPFFGYLAEQMPGEWEECRKDILRLGFAEQEQEQFKVRQDIARALSICCEPDTFLLIQDKDGGGSIICCMKPREFLAIVLRQDGDRVDIKTEQFENTGAIREILAGLLTPYLKEISFSPVVLPAEGLDAVLKTEGNIPEEDKGMALDNLAAGLRDDALSALTSPQRSVLVSYGDLRHSPPFLNRFSIYQGDTVSLKVRRYAERMRDLAEVALFSRGDIDTLILSLV